MRLARSAMRWALGLALVAHGLGNAVLPLRGVDAGPWAAGSAAIALLYIAAIVGFVAAGAGVLGVDIFGRHRAPVLATVAAICSLAAEAMLLAPDLWPGVVLDVTLPVLTYAYTSALQPYFDRPRHRWWHGALNVAGVAFFAWIAASAVLWPWHRAWGTTDREWALALPGDRQPRTPSLELMHGVSIAAPPERVWPWLVQLGQDRAGFYSYERLERLFGDDIHNTTTIHREWQTLRPGDHVYATQAGYLEGVLPERPGWRVAEVQPNRALVLEGWGAFVLLPDTDGGTRFLVRSTVSNDHVPVWIAALNFSAFELPHFIMQRRMMLTIKSLSEART